jgi:ABC-type transport system involved in cytochrome bd biosynthesis fused ATPase/permease subunit
MPASSNIPTYARVLPNVCLGSSILFAVVSVLTGIALLTLSGFSVLIPLFVGLPVSLGGSIFLAFLPALTLKFFVVDQRVGWALWISGVSAAMSGVASILVAMLVDFGGGVC